MRRPAVVKAAMPGRAPRQPMGRSEELQERMRYGRSERQQSTSVQEVRPQGRREYRETMYDDFDVYAEDRRYDQAEKKRRKRRDPHRGLWLMVMILCISCIAVLGVLVAPQLLGVQIPGLPSLAFVNGSIITMNAQEYEQYRTYRRYMDTDTIYPGVYIDGVHVGGMTVEEAEAAVWQVGASAGGSFSVTVNVGLPASTDESVLLPEPLGPVIATKRSDTEKLTSFKISVLPPSAASTV